MESSSRGGIIDAPVAFKRQDPLWGARVQKTFENGTFSGQVVNVELDARTGRRAYHVVYEDADEEHMTGTEVQYHMVRPGLAGSAFHGSFSSRRLSAPAELDFQSWPPVGTLTQRTTREQGAYSGDVKSLPCRWLALAVCVLACVAWRFSPCWSCIPGLTDGSSSDHIGAREPWEEQMPPPAVPAWEVLAALRGPSSAPEAAQQQDQVPIQQQHRDRKSVV